MGTCTFFDQAPAGRHFEHTVERFEVGKTDMGEHHSAGLWKKSAEKDIHEVPKETKFGFVEKNSPRDVSDIETASPSSPSENTDSSSSNELNSIGSELQTVENTSENLSTHSSPSTLILHGGATPKSARSKIVAQLLKTPKSSRMADFPNFTETRRRGDESNTCQKLEVMVYEFMSEEANPFCLPVEDDASAARRYSSAIEESVRVTKSVSIGSVRSMTRTVSARMRSSRQVLSRRVRRWLPKSSGRVVPTNSWTSSDGVRDDDDIAFGQFFSFWNRL